MRPINIMISGIPGNMGITIATHAMKDERFEVLPFSLTGPEIEVLETRVNGMTFKLIPPSQKEKFLAAPPNPEMIVIDYTHPTAVMDNAAAYCKYNIPFVMGTTGGDRDQLLKITKDAGVYAVIAPNMAKQIVGLQAMMAYAAETFPGLFEGYDIHIKESHQKGKADTSGTAKAMVGYFNRLGVAVSEADIIKVRDPDVQQKELGVPEAHIGGHAWHTYTLTSKDKNALFALTHNINRRDIYAAGTLDAVAYLGRKIAAKADQKLYTMIDVLKNQ